MAAQNYGTIGTVPIGDYDSNKQYKVGNIVTYTNGSSYLVHTIPPIGTLPTDKNYWQVSAQGGGYASLDAPGVVQPDGDTVDISNDAIISVRTATQNTLGVVKGSEDISIEADGKIGINTSFEQATELANIIANEAWNVLLGKISKSIATTMGLDENALLKSMISNQYENVTTKAASAALVNNLKQSLDSTNSNLATVGTFQISYGSRKTIPTNTKNWLCDWMNISAGTYLVGFTTQPVANVATYLKVTTGSPSLDRGDYALLLNGSGNASRVIKVESDSIISAIIENESGASYEVFVDPGAYFAWALRIK